MHWPSSVYPITAADGGPDFGTGFVVWRDHNAALIVTSWHVVRNIGRDRLRIDGNPCELVSEEGDDALDLAVLRAQGLARARPLALLAAGAEHRAFTTFGYAPIGRPLRGALGARTWRDHPRKGRLPAWDFYLEGDRVLDEIRRGYSGSPVLDTETQAVVAVITHGDEHTGFAIDIANPPLVHESAAEWLATRDGHKAPVPVAQGSALDAPPTDDYDRLDQELVKLLNHQARLLAIAERLEDGRPFIVALLECHSRDWPSDLADHLLREHARAQTDRAYACAVPLKVVGRDKRAIWRALTKVAEADRLPAEQDRRNAVRAKLAGPGLTVVYVYLELRLYAAHLTDMLAGATEDLTRLGEPSPGNRLLLLVAVARSGERSPFWWRWRHLPRLRRRALCVELPQLEPLRDEDVGRFHATLSALRPPGLAPDSIKRELDALFVVRARVPYAEARDLLMGDNRDDAGALRRAQIQAL